MNQPGRASIRFTLNGHGYELVRDEVECRLADVAPDVIRKHAVRVNGTWFPAMHWFEVATGIPRVGVNVEHRSPAPSGAGLRGSRRCGAAHAAAGSPYRARLTRCSAGAHQGRRRAVRT